MKISEALEIVEPIARDAEIDNLLIDLLRTASPQTEKLEADPVLRASVRDTIRPRIEALSGVRPLVDGMGNLIVQLGPKTARTDGGLVLMSYVMTFPPASMAEPYAGNIVSGAPFNLSGLCARGRGACEQKGPLAAMIGAAALLARCGAKLLNPFYLVVSLAGETGRHDTAKFILENNAIQASHGVVGLGTCNRVCLGNKGRVDIEVVVRGKSCHSSTPWAGIDAIKGARQMMERLESLQLSSRHPQLGVASLTPTRIESGPAISHTIQDICRVILDRRLLPGEEPQQALEAIRLSLEGLEPWTFEVSLGAFMYPSEVPLNTPIAEALQVASTAVSKGSTEPFYSPSALDAGFLNRMGIKTVMFGPGDLRFAHTDNELVSFIEVRDAARIYAAAALTLLA